MSNAMPSPRKTAATTVVDPAELQAHIVKVKAAWRSHEQAMTWEEKIAAIERMWERSAQLARARELQAPTLRIQSAVDKNDSLSRLRRASSTSRSPIA